MEVVVNTVVEEQREEVEVEKEDNTALKEGNETVDDANNWARVSPAKVGRSPVRPDQRKYTEDFQISASKVLVLSVEDGEEGEIMEERLQVSAVEIPKTNPEKYEDEGMSLVEEKPTQLNEDENLWLRLKAPPVDERDGDDDAHEDGEAAKSNR
ncbi:hypothetical protein F2Q69_00047366 [Brassica cretica]|uniref:Uncharacterized protein n=1 Tax=Brassica cretica TaxID=69181 RepID=A0A8S9PZQ9_BRACR|nr:hypothetical protein F2Q69_00047366 [Brassica cretica]